MTERSWIDTSGNERLRGTIDPDPGGSQPVSCVLHWQGDVAAMGFHDIDWDALYADDYNQDPLVALPAGLGITTAFDGSDGTLTTTTAGLWAFTFGIATPGDATWTGQLNLNAFSLNMALSGPGKVANAIQGGTFALPLAASTLLTFQTVDAATAGTYLADVWLSLVRFA